MIQVNLNMLAGSCSVLQNQWAAMIAFTAFFTLLNALGNDPR
jgi:hypothetical protein